jgi:1,2-diacylglycerol 3-beta-galactosyltransferase
MAGMKEQYCSFVPLCYVCVNAITHTKTTIQVSGLAKALQRTILFLIADTGAGHRSAANAIRNAITLISQKEQEEWHARQQECTEKDEQCPTAVAAPPTYRIEIVDVFEEYARFPLREAMKLYGPAIRYNPRLYGRVYHISNEQWSASAVKSMSKPLIHSGLLRLFTDVKPDIVVSVHPLLNHVAVRALLDLGLIIPILTVVTDLVSVHNMWFSAGVDEYIVPTEEAKALYLSHGLDPVRVRVLGMPIDPKFTLPTESKQELQKKIGLEPGLPVVLLVGGGDGAGGLQDAVRAISRARLPVQLLIVTGRNRRLYAYLQRIRSNLRVPAKVFGFVQNMPEMMRAADVIVTKAGPGTISEALACELPIVLSGYVPGQEEGNVDYVLNNGVGILAHDSIELVDALRRLLKPGSQLMQQQLANAKRLSHPGASFDITKAILSFLPPPGVPSVWETASWRKRRRVLSIPLGAEVRVRVLRRRLPRMTRTNFMKSPALYRLPHLRTQKIRARLVHPTLHKGTQNIRKLKNP